MVPKHYAGVGASKISTFSVPPIHVPERIDILWIRTHSFERYSRQINMQSHKHSFFEVHFVFKGSIIYEVAGTEYRLAGDKALLIPPELTHRIRSFSEDLVKINISFSGADSSFAPLVHGKGYRFSINGYMMDDFDRIFAEAEHREAHYLYVIRDRVFSILCTVLRSAGLAESTELSERESFACEIAARYIEDNKNLFLNCADVAAYCNCNEKYLSRRFKRECGMTLLEYIHSVKMKEAERLLLETDTLLSEVAEMLGFSNEYYFNSFFKRHCGMTPGAYRERGKNGR